MDQFSTPVQPLPERSGKSHEGLIRIAFIAIILAAIITIAEYGFPYMGHNVVKSHSLALSIGPFPASPQYTVDAKNNTLTPLMVTVDGKELAAVDAVRATDGNWYYILIEPSKTVASNLYVRRTDGTLTKLTNTQTAKFNLTYNPESGLLAYQQATVEKIESLGSTQDWTIAIYNPSNGTSHSIGRGINPTVVSPNTLLLRTTKGLVALNPNQASSTPSILLDLAKVSTYAASTDGTKLALYNQTTHKIDRYTLSDGRAPSFVSSAAIPYVPTALGYVGEVLTAAGASPVDKTHTRYTVSSIDGTRVSSFNINYESTFAPQRIYAYE